LNKPFVCEIEVEPRKGLKVKTRWIVEQDRPYPTAERGRWRQGGGWFSEAGEGPGDGEERGTPRHYTASLLAEGVEPPEDWNRTHLAGYRTYSPGGDKGAPLPGSVTLRGNDLGEMTVSWEADKTQYATITVRGYAGRCTAAEHGWIAAHILPGLVAFAEDNRAPLFARAIEALRKRFAEVVADMRGEAGRLEASAGEIVAKLEKG
jgi:hypothetical protein